MPLTSSIREYDETWPHLFEDEAARLRPILRDTEIDIHHVGSTAVMNLAAKPEIDILVVASDVRHLCRWQDSLLTIGYKRGGDLMKGHHFFKRDVGAVRTHKLHICIKGHSQVERMLRIRDRLRINAEDRKAYEALKLRLEQENKTGISEYLKGKAPFLDDLYRRSQSRS
ncbi:MAG: GrpB family protein [Litoreibacter sp.]